MEKQKKSYIPLNNEPNMNYFWAGLGGTFDNLSDIIREFVDNSISNLEAHNNLRAKNILIYITQEKNNYSVAIRDTGTGINDLGNAFAVGGVQGREGPLNEHGFGMKHALAAANKSNDSWKVYSKKAGESFYTVIKAPYKMHLAAMKYSGSLPIQENDELSSDHGTIIKFNISFNWLKTITRGVSGNYTTLSAFMKMLQEDLSFTYGSVISSNSLSISLLYKDNDMNDYKQLDITKLKPFIYNTLDPGSGTKTINLGKGEIKMDYGFYDIKKPPHKEYKKHYLANMNTSGAEISLNGRVLADNIFSDIWKTEQHNSYNSLLVKINLRSNDLNKLPKTTTTKTSLKQDDICLSNLYQWIYDKYPSPRKDSSKKDEGELFDTLFNQKENELWHYDNSLALKREEPTYRNLSKDNNSSVQIDLYQSFMDKVTIYEGKEASSKPIDLYQLLMYWDGLKYDHHDVHEGVLIAKDHSSEVKNLVNHINRCSDDTGKRYNIRLTTWSKLEIQHMKDGTLKHHLD